MALLLGPTYWRASHFGVYLVHLSIFLPAIMGFLDVFVLPALHLISDMDRAFGVIGWHCVCLSLSLVFCDLRPDCSGSVQILYHHIYSSLLSSTDTRYNLL